jgi:hypothetical protein
MNAFCLVCPVILNGRLGMTSGLLAIVKVESACTVCGLCFLCPDTKLGSVNPVRHYVNGSVTCSDYVSDNE